MGKKSTQQKTRGTFNPRSGIEQTGNLKSSKSCINVGMLKIIFFDVEDYETDVLKQACEGKYDYKLINSPLNDMTDFSENILKADVISCFTTSRVTGNILKKFSNLKLIALRSVGFNHIDIDYCKENDIAVETTPNYGNKSVAEFAFGLMIDVSRKITRAYNDLVQEVVNPHLSMGFELGGKTIGIIGLGAIGSEMARLAHGFDMNILGFDIRENVELEEKYGVKYTNFDSLLENSDVISLHAPLTKENHHLFNEESIKKMKPSAVLINTARGELVDSQALYNALSSGAIGGAGLDVLEFEESLSNPDYLVDIDRLSNNSLKKTILNTRLLKLENVIITPHMAYDTIEAVTRILNTTIENINAFSEGRIQNNVVK